ncbi:hypothetical protein R1T08_03290 [Streptomyces sp. SBC-4]|nr:hypothetical protein [Streptomyces sp. SBC-4]MDV5143350.1 hypothetical protein [Streptomyces sp. SBC-4]
MSFAIRYSLTLAEEETPGGPAGLLGTVAEAAGPLSALAGLTTLPLNVSNDVFGGSLVLDADITVTMGEGAVASTFEAVLVNLPAETVRTLRAALARRPLSATVRLGYFDDRSVGRHPVMAGRVVKLASWVAEDGLSRVRLTGQDAGGYALRMTSASVHRAEATDALQFAEKVVTAAGLTLAKGSALTTKLTDHTVRNPTALDALRELADNRPRPRRHPRPARPHRPRRRHRRPRPGRLRPGRQPRLVRRRAGRGDPRGGARRGAPADP